MDIARRIDPLMAYELAVQDADTEVGYFERTFRRYRGRQPHVMREDFCGTSALSLSWIQKRNHRAIAIDLDLPTLDWVAQHRLSKLPPSVAGRLRQVHGDVRKGSGERVDLVCGMNFSYMILKTRPALLQWLRCAYRELVSDGILFMDLFGGQATMQDNQLERSVEHPHVLPRMYRNFTYEWRQDGFDALTHQSTCSINFRFPDGSCLDRAFTYDWRLWTCPELRDALHEAGFQDVRFLQCKVSKAGTEIDRYFEPKQLTSTAETWWLYVVALK
ncbi:MAG TPA: class I SAM-dependent methyltransferase [Candidatus Xenobia bacterium]|jgi:hypothetical protein